MQRVSLFLIGMLWITTAPSHANERSGAFAIRGGTALSAAMGEAAAVLLDRPDVLLWNPAALVRVVEPRLELAYHDVYGLGVAHHAHAALGWRATREELVPDATSLRVEGERGNGAAIGLALDVTAVDIGDGGANNYTEASPTLALAVPLLPHASVGGAFRLLGVTSSIDNVEGAGYALDLGFTSALYERRILLAASLRNVLGSVSWTDGGSEALRREATGAIGVSLHPRVRAGLAAVDDLGNEGIDQFVLAAHVSVQDYLSIVLGWESRRNGTKREARLTPALSVHVDDRFDVDYAFVPAGDAPGDTHRVSISVGL